MSTYTLHEDWEEFDSKILESKIDEIEALAKKFTTTEKLAEEGGLEYAESLLAAKNAVEALLADRAAEDAKNKARTEAVLAGFANEPDPEPETGDDDDSEDDTDGDDGDTETEAQVEPVEPAAETVEVEVPETVDPEPVAEVIEPDVVEPDPTPVAEAPTEPAPERELVGATAATQRNTSASLRAMNARRTADETPQPRSDTLPVGRMRAAGEMTADGWKPGDFLSNPDSVSKYIAQQLRSLAATTWEGPRTKIPLLTSQVEFDNRLTSTDVERNMRAFNEVAGGYEEALVAAGGPCAPLMPTYEFESCYSPQRPVESSLPVIGAERGGIKYLSLVSIADADAGITVKDSTAAALVPGDGGYAAKTCVRFDCPTETEVTVGLVSQCLTVDNLRSRVFPEFVAEMMKALATQYAKRKEIFYIDRLDTLAGAAVDIAAAQASPYGIGRSLFQELVTIRHNYIKRNNMSPGAIVDVWLPTVVEPSLAADTMNDPNMSAVGSIVGGPNGNLAQVLVQRAGLNLNWYYYDGTDAGFPVSEHSDAAGAWNPMPTIFRSYVAAPGAVVRLDGGSLDLGVVRDSTLNADNDMQIFAEQWLEVAQPGCEIVAHDHTTCYNGVGPLHVAAPACPDPEAP